MNRYPLVLAALVGTSLLATPTIDDAEACSPGFPMQGNRPSACRKMRVHVPAPQFPENLADDMRLSAATDGFAMMAENEFPTDKPIIYRQTKDGWKKVAYKLVDQKNLVKGAKALRLPAPLAGTYSVVWKHETCSAEPAPVGKGNESARFTITPAAEVPTTIGKVSVANSEVVKERVRRGEGGDCKPIYADVVRHETELKLALSAEMKPWGESPSIALEVDGKIVAGYSPIGSDAVKSGTYTRVHAEQCSASDQKRDLRKLDNGKHTARLVARMGNLDPVKSEPVTFEVRCP